MDNVHIIKILCMYNVHIIRILCMYNVHIIRILYMYNVHIISISYMYNVHIIYIFDSGSVQFKLFNMSTVHCTVMYTPKYVKYTLYGTVHNQQITLYCTASKYPPHLPHKAYYWWKHSSLHSLQTPLCNSIIIIYLYIIIIY